MNDKKYIQPILPSLSINWFPNKTRILITIRKLSFGFGSLCPIEPTTTEHWSDHLHNKGVSSLSVFFRPHHWSSEEQTFESGFKYFSSRVRDSHQSSMLLASPCFRQHHLFERFSRGRVPEQAGNQFHQCTFTICHTFLRSHWDWDCRSAFFGIEHVVGFDSGAKGFRTFVCYWNW